MKVVLGAPYSNATFAFFERATGHGHRDFAENHPYYKQLYAPVTHDSTSIASALHVIFEETFLSSIDFPVPGNPIQDGDSTAYSVPELDMTISSKFDSAIRSGGVDLVTAVGAERQLAESLLRLTGVADGGHFVPSAMSDLLASVALDRPLVCGSEWVALYRAVAQLMIDAGEIEAAGAARAIAGGQIVSEGVGTYSQVCGLAVTSEELAIFAELRANDAIRKYSTLFTAHLAESGSVEMLFEALSEARERTITAKENTETFAAAATTFGVASLVPGLGTFAGVAGLSLDAAGRAAANRSEAHSWYALGPEITRFESETRLRRHLEQQGSL